MEENPEPAEFELSIKIRKAVLGWEQFVAVSTAESRGVGYAMTSDDPMRISSKRTRTL